MKNVKTTLRANLRTARRQLRKVSAELNAAEDKVNDLGFWHWLFKTHAYKAARAEADQLVEVHAKASETYSKAFIAYSEANA